MDANFVHRIEQRIAILVRAAGERGIPFDVSKATALLNELATEKEQIRLQVESMVQPRATPVRGSRTKRDDLVVLAQKLNLPADELTVDSYAKCYKSARVPKGYDGLPIGGPWSPVEFRPFDIGSNKEVKEYLLSVGWRPLEWNYKNNRPTSPKLNDEDPFAGVSGELGKLLVQYVKASKRHSDVTSYMKHLTPAGRIKCGANTCGCDSRRFRHRVVVNVANPARGSYKGREVRELFRVPQGYRWVGLDLDQSHLYIMGWLCGDTEMMHQIRHGKKKDGSDVHTQNAVMYGLPDPGGEGRELGKIVTYSLLNNGGPTLIAKQLHTPVTRAKVYIENFKRGRPKFAAFSRQTREIFKSFGGKLLLPGGEAIYPKKENSALGATLQAVEATILKMAVCIWHMDAKTAGIDAELLLVYHDEFNTMAREGEDAEKCAELMEKAVARACRLYGMQEPIPCKAAIGGNWYECH